MRYMYVINELKIVEKKKKLKKEGKTENSVQTPMEEETEEGYRHAVYVMTMKLFADMERRRLISIIFILNINIILTLNAFQYLKLSTFFFYFFIDENSLPGTRNSARENEKKNYPLKPKRQWSVNGNVILKSLDSRALTAGRHFNPVPLLQNRRKQKN